VVRPAHRDINGLRMLIVGLGDGAIHAIKPQTGQKIWSFVAAKRAINTGVAVQGNSVFVSHGDENLDTNVMGMIAAIDGSQTGNITATRWAVKGGEFGYSPPVMDGSRVYQSHSRTSAAGRPARSSPRAGSGWEKTSV
jgi:outer membrane protein assembly factor BamB